MQKHNKATPPGKRFWLPRRGDFCALFWGQAILQKNPGGAVTKTPRGTTLSRQGAEGAAAIGTILDRACPEYERLEVYSTALSGEQQSVALDLCWTPEDPRVGAGEQADLFPLDAPFDPAVTARVPDRLCAQILWDGEAADADFEAVADAFDAALTVAGYDIDYYDLTLVPRGADHEELQALDLDRLIRK